MQHIINRNTLIIAEAGVNHNGDVRLAKQLVDAAANAGADYVKFQSFKAKRQATSAAQKAKYQLLTTDASETQYEMLLRLELSETDHRELIDHCALRNINFFSTAFDIESVDFLQAIGQKLYKVPSGEITNLPYLRHIGKIGAPVLLSTGMSTLGEVEAAIDTLENSGTPRDNITVLHCTTEYPTQMTNVNLLAMQTMSTAFGVKVGYSDHTSGIEVAIAAVATGASVIEKHLTLDRSLPGPDHLASSEPREFKDMVSAIRNIELALGDGIKRLTPGEIINKPVARKSLVAARSIMTGEQFTHYNLAVKRPGTGISPMRWDEFLDKRATRDFDVDELIDEER
jgi:N,N'-diacetyllegionaminate synthase